MLESKIGNILIQCPIVVNRRENIDQGNGNSIMQTLKNLKDCCCVGNFYSGCFACPEQYYFEISLRECVSMSVENAIVSLRTTVLDPLSVSGGAEFVSKDNNGILFYFKFEIIFSGQE